jgi:hypothetical protein
MCLANAVDSWSSNGNSTSSRMIWGQFLFRVYIFFMRRRAIYGDERVVLEKTLFTVGFFRSKLHQVLVSKAVWGQMFLINIDSQKNRNAAQTLK